jgi:protein TonB
MLAIAVAHIALIAVVMSAKMDLPARILRPPIVVDTIPLPDKPLEPVPPEPQAGPIETIKPVPTPLPLPLPSDNPILADPAPLPFPDGSMGTGAMPGPAIDPPRPAPVMIGPRFATPAGLVRPAYPASKINSEEEAVLKLRLSIAANGRVVAVEPVGAADRAFLDAARRHIIARWRYKPATEDGGAVASSTVITLRFELDS